MAFDVRDYMWNVFEIANELHVENIRIALDLFIVNIELGRERYHGSSFKKYPTLHKKWEPLTESERNKQRIIFNEVIHKAYPALRDAWNSNDRETFDALAHCSLRHFGIPETDPTYTPIKVSASHFAKAYKKNKDKNPES